MEYTTMKKSQNQTFHILTMFLYIDVEAETPILWPPDANGWLM